jgi:microcompartment protein CcmK/EutM
VRLARVVGSVVATRKDASLEGTKLLVVENLSLSLEREGGYAVAVDAVGAGAGEVVLYCSGSSARQTPTTKDRPVDAVIMAIVDSFDANGKNVRLA